MNTRRTVLLIVAGSMGMTCSQCGIDLARTEIKPPADAGTDSSPTEDAGSTETLDAMVNEDGSKAFTEWMPIPGLEMCDGMRLNLAMSTWPSRTWTSCGPGCLTAPAAMHVPGQLLGGAYHSGAATIQGETYLRTALYGKTENYQELRRMSDDAVLFVMRFRKGCYVSAGQEGAPFLFQAFESGGPDDGTLDFWVARFDITTMSLLIHPGLVTMSPYTQHWLAWNDGWGVLNSGKVRLALDPNTANLTTVYEGGGSQAYGRGHGDLVAWIDWGAWPTPIRSYTKAGGQKILFQGDYGIAGLAIGDTRIAWVGVTGPYVQVGGYETAVMYWSPRTSDPAAIQVTEGPSLSGKLAGRANMDTAGDFVVMTSAGDPKNNGNGRGTHVVRASTGEYWFIPAPENSYVTLAVASDNEVLVMENSMSDNSFTYFPTYIRYDLSKLDELSQSIP